MVLSRAVPLLMALQLCRRSGKPSGCFSRSVFLSFGGPAGQIALMHRVLVDEKRWLDEAPLSCGFELLHAFCPALRPCNLRLMRGWRLHGVAGGLVAGLLFVLLPGALLILALALLYLAYGTVPLVVAAFGGIKAAVLAIVVEALMRVSKRALHRRLDWAVAMAAFLGLFAFAVPFPLIVIAAAALGFVAGSSPGPMSPAAHSASSGMVPFSQTARTVGVWLLIWIIPLAGVALVFGQGHVLTEIGLLYSKLAVW